MSKKLTRTQTERIIKMTETTGWKALKEFYVIQKRETFAVIFNLDENDENQRKIITTKKKEFKALETLIFDIESMSKSEIVRKTFEQEDEDLMKDILPEGYKDFSLDGDGSGQDDDN